MFFRCMEESMSDAELQTWEQERADRSLFVQELFLSTLAGIEALSMPSGESLNLSGGKGEQESVGKNSSTSSDDIGNKDGFQASRYDFLKKLELKATDQFSCRNPKQDDF